MMGRICAVKHLSVDHEAICLELTGEKIIVLSLYFLSGLPLALGLMLLLINPKFMLHLLAPSAAQPVGWLIAAAIVGLVVAAYVVQRKILRSTPMDTSAGVVQSIPLQSRLYLVGTLALFVFPAILLVLLGPAIITILLSGVL